MTPRAALPAETRLSDAIARVADVLAGSPEGTLARKNLAALCGPDDVRLILEAAPGLWRERQEGWRPDRNLIWGLVMEAWHGDLSEDEAVDAIIQAAAPKAPEA